jgi:hypothetical protein
MIYRFLSLVLVGIALTALVVYGPVLYARWLGNRNQVLTRIAEEAEGQIRDLLDQAEEALRADAAGETFLDETTRRQTQAFVDEYREKYPKNKEHDE